LTAYDEHSLGSPVPRLNLLHACLHHAGRGPGRCRPWRFLDGCRGCASTSRPVRLVDPVSAPCPVFTDLLLSRLAVAKALPPAADHISSKESRILEKQSWGRREEIDGSGGLLFRSVGEDRSKKNARWEKHSANILSVVPATSVWWRGHVCQKPGCSAI
jgi:hypothetical protein